MRKSPINRVSVKQRVEKRLREKVWWELVANTDGICPNCKLPLNHDWMGFQMHHTIPLSRGGKTDMGNCQLWCYSCHHKEHNGKRFKVNGQ